MAKTRRQKKLRGGDVKDGEYVYGLHVSTTMGNVYDTSQMFPPVVYRHLGKALDAAVDAAREFVSPRHELQVLVTDPNDVRFQRNGSQLIARVRDMAYIFVYLRRYKLSEEVPNVMKPGQRVALAQLADKEEIPPKVEQTIAEMSGIRGR